MRPLNVSFWSKHRVFLVFFITRARQRMSDPSNMGGPRTHAPQLSWHRRCTPTLLLLGAAAALAAAFQPAAALADPVGRISSLAAVARPSGRHPSLSLMPDNSVFALRLRGGAPKSPAKSSHAGEKRAGGAASGKAKAARTGKAKSAGADSESGESGEQVRRDSHSCWLLSQDL